MEGLARLARLLCPWGFSSQEYWSGLSCLPPGDFPNPGIEPRSSSLQADSLLSEPPGKPKNTGVGGLSLLQEDFPTRESNQGLLHGRQTLSQLSYLGSPVIATVRIKLRSPGFKGGMCWTSSNTFSGLTSHVTVVISFPLTDIMMHLIPSQVNSGHLQVKRVVRDFAGGPVAKTQCSQGSGAGFDP